MASRGHLGTAQTGLPDSVLLEARDAVFKINVGQSENDNVKVSENYELALLELAKADSIHSMKNHFGLLLLKIF